ncbi:MAG TPA: Sec-independent protein translocase protein TatB [Stellaceae bacterium]|jgi:sec-independent protein translocase protein TatB|nr:Sec-independent protein translocase protein TatB [Stellaceae bacterium]
MFDFAWSEIALIAVVALVVIGPKDLPRVLKTAGFWVRKARGIAREFQGSLEQMVQDAELDDVKRGLDKATSFNFDQEMAKAVDPGGEIADSLRPPELTNPLTDAPKPAPEPAILAPPTPAETPAASPEKKSAP